MAASSIAEIDAIYDSNDFRGAHAALQAAMENEENAKNVEYVWRYARVQYNMYTIETSADLKKEYANASFATAAKALELDPNHFASHKWYSICLSASGDFKGQTERIQDAFVIREHADRALELNPNDASTEHLIGRWCFTFADMGIAVRAIASTIFASPPTSTYEESLKYFLAADEHKTVDFPLNSVWVGKLYAKLGQKDKARVHFDKALATPINNAADQDAHDQATAGIAALSSWW